MAIARDERLFRNRPPSVDSLIAHFQLDGYRVVFHIVHLNANRELSLINLEDGMGQERRAIFFLTKEPN